MADAVETLPEYVEFGLRSTSPGPYRCSNGRMRVLVLEGNEKCINDLVKRTLTRPAGGKVEYRPLGPYVVLFVGTNRVRSLTKPWADWGWVPEALAAFFVPVWAGHARNGDFHAERLCMSVPHIFVDNPMSYLVGREVLGYAKALGRFEPSTGFLDGSVVIHGFGGDFAPDAQAGWVPVVKIAPADGAGAEAEDEGPMSDEPGEFVRELGSALLPDAELPDRDIGVEVALPGLRVIARLIKQLCAGQGHQVFLKQFRDAGEVGRACYQAVVEAPTRMEKIRWRLSRRDWDVQICPVESHPLTKELGISSGRVPWSAELRDFQFVVETGIVIGP
jgi:hypothetical protein